MTDAAQIDEAGVRALFERERRLREQLRTIREAALLALRSEDAKVWERALWEIGVNAR